MHLCFRDHNSLTCRVVKVVDVMQARPALCHVSLRLRQSDPTLLPPPRTKRQLSSEAISLKMSLRITIWSSRPKDRTNGAASLDRSGTWIEFDDGHLSSRCWSKDSRSPQTASSHAIQIGKGFFNDYAYHGFLRPHKARETVRTSTNAVKMFRTIVAPTRTVMSQLVRHAHPAPPATISVRLYSGRILSNGMISSRVPKPSRAGEQREPVGKHWPEEPDDFLDHHGPWNKISEAVKNDHRQLEAYYVRMTKSDDQAYQEEYQNAFIWKLSRHSIAEEIVLYPNLERCVEKGNYMASQDRHEHYKVRKVTGRN